MLRYANIGLIARFPVGLGKNLASSFNNVSYKFFLQISFSFLSVFSTVLSTVSLMLGLQCCVRRRLSLCLSCVRTVLWLNDAS